jgi:flavorubredoxin
LKYPRTIPKGQAIEAAKVIPRKILFKLYKQWIERSPEKLITVFFITGYGAGSIFLEIIMLEKCHERRINMAEAQILIQFFIDVFSFYK